jgi:hypothetical protein
MVRYTNLENRLNDDTCSQKNKELLNASVNNRNLYNFYYTNDCKCSAFDDTLFDNNFVVKDGYGYTSGCVVDMDSELRNNFQVTHDKLKQQLCVRTFTGVPNLNTGGLIPNIETRLKNGDDTSDIRRCDIVPEKSFIPYTFYDLKPCIAEVQNPEHIIETGWVRGGAITRDWVRDNSYLEKCGFAQTPDKKNWVRRETQPVAIN